ncbi:hypothetical protein M885DRAFT_506289 [Pelagophyceae sp. CCMP2097]|nr:hypothetical protein M885DRAFT_506289 [Pelagophyceae sp. CCMP2097]|eukprot:CAMPEP_0184109062 /NCGR_PEP_ID=MMETSP0974-20121125/16697_1 /TAXON_ID=483370 /ORGANISM="non described non described, Strain CCMP2097" /LENGTH=75 /DNA_ID=CAMNT_0026412095 /DNA_START=65 /DNA_END=292 /DNA_ORIENTATION=+
MEQTVVFDVQMACGGCSGACTRILNKMGVKSVDANLETQKVTVVYEESAELTPQTMLEKLLVWAKSANKTVALAS